MQCIGWLENLDQPAKCFDSLMRAIRLVMDLPGWSMRDQNIQVSAKSDLIVDQAGNKTKDHEPVFLLGVLIRTLIVLQAAFKPRQEQPGVIFDDPAMQVHCPQGLVRSPAVVNSTLLAWLPLT